jgi:uncharacterized protein (DUF2267 family)
METDKFLHEVELRLGVSNETAKRVTAAVFQELHDRLNPKEADDLGAQLPGDLKGMWHGLDVPGREVRRTHKRDFVRHVAEAAELPEDEASRGVTAVFKVLQMSLKSPTGQEGEAWDVFSQLPKDLKRVWLAAAGMAAPKKRAPTAPASR